MNNQAYNADELTARMKEEIAALPYCGMVVKFTESEEV